MKHSLLTVLLCTLFSFSLFSQVQPQAGDALGDLCSDPEACNYNSLPFALNGLEETCYYYQWAIPINSAEIEGPALYICQGEEIPEGYTVPVEQECLSLIIENDTYCYQVSWDSICQDAFDACVDFGLGCGDPSSCNFSQETYNLSEFCEYEQWYIPNLDVILIESPAVLACDAPSGYILADECCVQQVLLSNSFCGDGFWAGLCQSAYEECVFDNTGCTNPADCNYDETACIDDGSCFGRYGCTYPDACNYDGLATVDDGSCEYPGCTDPEALNFEPFAPCNSLFPGDVLGLKGIGGGGPIINGACIYAPENEECVGDLDGDDIVGSADLTIFLSNFGNNCSPIIIVD